MGQNLKNTVDFFSATSSLSCFFLRTIIFTIIQSFLSEKPEDEGPSIKEAPVVEEGTDYTDYGLCDDPFVKFHDDDGNEISCTRWQQLEASRNAQQSYRCTLPKKRKACKYSPAWFFDPARGDCTRLRRGKCPRENTSKFDSRVGCRAACGYDGSTRESVKVSNCSGGGCADQIPRHSEK